jgi:hypothetical protein
MLSSYNEECCINPGVCLDITPGFFNFDTFEIKVKNLSIARSHF